MPAPPPQRNLIRSRHPGHGPHPAGGREGLELARAYIDLGDDEAARGLLREVLDGHDPAAREEAARLLRELG
jgi:pilus assembly protein FimV